MNKLSCVPFVAALALLSGCIVYQMDKTPPCDGLSDAAKAECKFKPKCLLKCEMNVHSGVVFGGNIRKDTAIAMQKDIMVEAVQESGLFASCLEGEAVLSSENDLSVVAKCEYDEDISGAFLTGLTLMAGPFACEYFFNFVFTVRDGRQETRQYRFMETVVERVGIPLLFIAPFTDCSSSHEETFIAMHRKVMNNLFVKMQQDGFFSAEGRDKAAAAKADAAEVLKKNAAARRKELEDLKKAGIIDEAEYAAEVKKLEGAGK